MEAIDESKKSFSYLLDLDTYIKEVSGVFTATTQTIEEELSTYFTTGFLLYDLLFTLVLLRIFFLYPNTIGLHFEDHQKSEFQIFMQFS